MCVGFGFFDLVLLKAKKPWDLWLAKARNTGLIAAIAFYKWRLYESNKTTVNLFGLLNKPKKPSYSRCGLAKTLNDRFYTPPLESNYAF